MLFRSEQLQPEGGEQLQGVAGRDVRSAAERLVDDREPEVPRLLDAPLQPELVGQRRREDRVRELLLLPADLPSESR